MRWLRTREDGFSLTEVMVVILIVAILIAIGIPTFLGMRRTAQETAAMDTALLAIKVARSYTTDETETFSTVTTASLNASEPSRDFIDGATSSAGPNEVSQVVPDAGAGAEIFVAAVQSESGSCFYARAFAHGGADFGRVNGTDCRADDHGSVVFTPSW